MISMPVKYGDVIKIQYEASYEDGTTFDSTKKNGGEPLKFQLGMGQIVRGFEEELIGMEIGEEKSFTLQPANAYGDFDPLLVKKVDLSQITGDISLELGKDYDVVAPNGMSSTGKIRLIEKDFILVDLNHPYAGKVLNFKVKILESDLEPEPVQNPFTFGMGCGDDCGHD